MKKKKNKIIICIILLILSAYYIRNQMILQVDPKFYLGYYEGLLEIGFFEKMTKYKVNYGYVSLKKEALMIVKDILRKEIGYLKELNERPYTIVKSIDNEYYFVSSVILSIGQLGGNQYCFIIRKKDGVVVWWKPK